MRRSISIRTYFTSTFVVLVIILTFILSALIGRKSTAELESQVGKSLAETAYQMTDRMSYFMWTRYGEIYTLAQLDQLKKLENPDKVQSLLDRLKESFPTFSWIGVTDDQGIVLASTDSILKGVDISERPVFMEGIKGKFIGDVHDAVLLANLLPNPSGEAMKFVDISVPIIDESGTTKGVLAAHLSWEWASEIQKTLMEPMNNRKDIEMFVISGTNNQILLGEKDSIGKPIGLSTTEMQDLSQGHWSIKVWDDGGTYLTGYDIEKGYMDYPGLGWKVIVRQRVDHAFASANELQKYIFIVGLTCAVFFSIICWLIAGKVSLPIKAISSVAEKFHYGEKLVLPTQTGIKEVEKLSSSLQELVHNLIESETEFNKMESVAHHDHLTGIANRTGLQRYLETLGSSLIKGFTYVILCMDLDNFKGVNDTYGHHIGDLVLKKVADILSSSVRNDEFVARLGGDEFVVIIRARSNAIEDGHIVGTRIITKLNVPHELEDYLIPIHCSIGASILKQGDNSMEIMKLADAALYESKKQGKNRISFMNKPL